MKIEIGIYRHRCHRRRRQRRWCCCCCSGCHPIERCDTFPMSFDVLQYCKLIRYSHFSHLIFAFFLIQSSFSIYSDGDFFPLASCHVCVCVFYFVHCVLLMHDLLQVQRDGNQFSLLQPMLSLVVLLFLLSSTYFAPAFGKLILDFNFNFNFYLSEKSQFLSFLLLISCGWFCWCCRRCYCYCCPRSLLLIDWPLYQSIYVHSPGTICWLAWHVLKHILHSTRRMYSMALRPIGARKFYEHMYVIRIVSI